MDTDTIVSRRSLLKHAPIAAVATALPAAAIAAPAVDATAGLFGLPLAAVHIERAVELLNDIDGDADTEDDGSTEPSLAGFGMVQTKHGILFVCNDLEDPQCAPERPRRRAARLRATDIRADVL